jgi:hypothetical protein
MRPPPAPASSTHIPASPRNTSVNRYSTVLECLACLFGRRHLRQSGGWDEDSPPTPEEYLTLMEGVEGTDLTGDSPCLGIMLESELPRERRPTSCSF